MSRPKKEKTHIKHTHNGLKFSSEEIDSKCDGVEIIVPKGMPYVKLRKALELALLRVR